MFFLRSRAGRKGQARAPRVADGRYRPTLELLESRDCPSVFYDFSIVGKTTAGNPDNWTTFGLGPTVNDAGSVAFVGDAGAGQGIYVSDLGGTPREITQTVGPGHTWTAGAQINNQNLVVGTDTQLGTPTRQQVVTYNAAPGMTGPPTVVAGSGDVGVLTFVAAALDGASNRVAFVQQTGGATQLYYSGGGVNHLVATFQGQHTLQPAAAGKKLVAAIPDGKGGSAIVLYDEVRMPGGAFQYRQTVLSRGFTAVGASPGISADGRVVVFAGDRGNGVGIFASIAGAGQDRTLIKLAGESAKAEPELGYAADRSKLFLSQFDLNQPVSVVYQSLGAAGAAGDSFVVSFLATPNGASTPNPRAVGERPLLFTAQQGIWSVRVDVNRQLDGRREIVYHANSPRPVVQIGDTIDLGGGQRALVQQLGVSRTVAAALTDAGGAARTQQRGDHQVVFWARTDQGQVVVRGRHLDSDQDGLLDHWETSGLDIDQDGTVDLNLAAMGADPAQRDLFIEVDWSVPRALGAPQPYGFQPQPGMLQQVVDMFAAAPAVGSIPAGIRAHIDAGASFSLNMGTSVLDGGSLVSMSGGAHPDLVYFGVPGSINVPGVNALAFQTAKETFFGSLERNARELVFHYTIMADYYSFLETAPYLGKVAQASATTLTADDDLPDNARFSAILITAGTGQGQLRYVKAVDERTVTLDAAWATVPDATSQFTFFSGSSGIGEVRWYRSPDFNAFAGNDFLITLGNFAHVDGNAGTESDQWRTLAHEIGHNFGLRHGGNNHGNRKPRYHSLMNYIFQFKPGAANVNSYSGAGDAVFNDWANVRLDFQSSFNSLGNTSRLPARSNAGRG